MHMYNLLFSAGLKLHVHMLFSEGLKLYKYIVFCTLRI